MPVTAIPTTMRLRLHFVAAHAGWRYGSKKGGSMCSEMMIKVIAGIPATIIGGLIGFLASYFISANNARNAAAIKFRSVMIPEQVKIETQFPKKRSADGTNFINHPMSKYIAESLPLHVAAIEEFKPFIKRRRRNEYIRASDDYIKKAKMHIGQIEELKEVIKFSENP
ncbi:hypothetical protein [Onishia taeanensis]|uniref:hypothetical protein n=1 Tax=Onishia taeanensis TaxID=284577 RepID=UPI001587A33A|nr:hypothetical protein [Halomonas taeanensis]